RRSTVVPPARLWRRTTATLGPSNCGLVASRRLDGCGPTLSALPRLRLPRTWMSLGLGCSPKGAGTVTSIEMTLSANGYRRATGAPYPASDEPLLKALARGSDCAYAPVGRFVFGLFSGSDGAVPRVMGHGVGGGTGARGSRPAVRGPAARAPGCQRLDRGGRAVR